MTRVARFLLLAACLACFESCAKGQADLEPFPCATDGSCPDPLVCIAGLCQDHQDCDVVKQDCPEADRSRCTIVVIGPLTPAADHRAECLPAQQGALSAGRECPKADTGIDQCEVGYYCASFGGVGDAGTCSQLCESNADCTAEGQQCFLFKGTSAANAGWCG